jgi:hypothetical protein
MVFSLFFSFRNARKSSKWNHYYCGGSESGAEPHDTLQENFATVSSEPISRGLENPGTLSRPAHGSGSR